MEEALQDKFVCGLSSEGVQRRLLVEAGLTLEKAFEMAQGMEAAAVDAKKFHSKPKETETASSNMQKVNTSQWKLATDAWESGIRLRFANSNLPAVTSAVN